ncbi:hypothetical protein D3C86_1490940 [compost metagenome]
MYQQQSVDFGQYRFQRNEAGRLLIQHCLTKVTFAYEAGLEEGAYRLLTDTDNSQTTGSGLRAGDVGRDSRCCVSHGMNLSVGKVVLLVEDFFHDLAGQFVEIDFLHICSL